MPFKPQQPPPKFKPKYCPAMKGTGSKFIKQYIGLFVYVWTVKGEGFWLYPTGINRDVLYGYIWYRSKPHNIHFHISKIDCLY